MVKRSLNLNRLFGKIIQDLLVGIVLTIFLNEVVALLAKSYYFSSMVLIVSGIFVALGICIDVMDELHILHKLRF